MNLLVESTKYPVKLIPRKIIVITAILVGLSALQGQQAHAFSGTISDQATCEAAGGVWTTPPDTCTVNGLFIASGETLTINSGIILQNTGTITNNGLEPISDSFTLSSHRHMGNHVSSYRPQLGTPSPDPGHAPTTGDRRNTPWGPANRFLGSQFGRGQNLDAESYLRIESGIS